MDAHRLVGVGLGDVLSDVARLIEERRPVRGIILLAIIEGEGFPAVADQALHGETGRLGDFGFRGALHLPPPGPGTIVADWPSSARRQVKVSPASNASREAIMMIATRFAAAIRLLLRPAQFLANAQDLAALKAFVAAQAPRYGEIGAPTVILTGSADTTVSPHIHARAASAAVPDARLIVLAGGGCLPHHLH